MPQTETTIALSSETRDRFKSYLRGGETAQALLERMMDQYDPEQRDN